MTDRVSKRTQQTKRPVAKQVYVVVPANFEYNDETYEHKGHGLPLSAYTSKKAANEACLKMNIEALRKGHVALGSMGWDYEEVFRDYGKCLDEIYKDEEKPDLYGIDTSSWTDEQCEAVVEQLRTPYYEVFAVEKK